MVPLLTMLALRQSRFGPILINTTTTRWYSHCAATGIAFHKLNHCNKTRANCGPLLQNIDESANKNVINTIPTNVTSSITVRYYCKKLPDPAPIKLPQKEQMLKIFFRVLAYIWDISYWMFTWARKLFMEHVVANPQVQLYYKKLRDKMEEAKHD